MVVQLGRTRRDTLKEITSEIERTGISLLGIVINRISRNSNYHSKYYGKYYDIPDVDEEVSDELDENFVMPQIED